ncbi:MAG: flagellar motor switch protein FliN [Phycisphaerae bacterium]|nr:flagellar motor switch protein FliN [Phycisphaerae bacterium]
MMEAAIAEEKAAAAAADAAAASEPHVAQAPIHKEAAVPPPLPPGATPLELQDFDSALADPEGKGIELLNDVELNVKIELGRAQMLIEDVLKLGEGAVVELDKLAGDPVDVLVNERLVARGEVLVLNDSFCVRISEIVAGVGLAEEA